MSTRTQAFSLVITAVLALGASAGGASAHSWRCDSSLGAWGRAPNGSNYEPPRPYDTVALARHRAIQNWKMRVRVGCPEHSAFWWRAGDKAVDCQGYAGGTACSVRARPALKLFR